MKNFYQLLTYECSRLMRETLLLCAAAILVPLLLLKGAIKEYQEFGVIERYEILYHSSGGMTVFFILLGLLIAVFLRNFYAGYWGGKSVYTFLTLPMRRSAVYGSKLASFALAVLMLLAAQLLAIRLGYGLVEDKISSIAQGQYVMANGLFLAFIRSNYLRILLPFSLNGVLSSCALLLTLLTGVYYAALIERSKRYWGFGLIVVAGYLMLKEWGFRMGLPEFFLDTQDYYIRSFLLLGLSVFFIWHGSRLIKKGAIA